MNRLFCLVWVGLLAAWAGRSAEAREARGLLFVADATVELSRGEERSYRHDGRSSVNFEVHVPATHALEMTVTRLGTATTKVDVFDSKTLPNYGVGSPSYSYHLYGKTETIRIPQTGGALGATYYLHIHPESGIDSFRVTFLYPGPPAGAPKVTVSQRDVGGVLVTWGGVAGATKWRVLRQAEGEATWREVASGNLPEMQVVDEDVKSGVTYTYRVMAGNAEGWSQQFGEQSLAYWVGPVEYVEVAFDANGGTLETPVRMYQVGKAYGDLPVPSQALHTFLGWYADAGLTMPVTETTKAAAVVVQLYAKWRLAEYTVKFELGGGIPGDDLPPEGTNGVAFRAGVPERPGWTFEGWMVGGEVDVEAARWGISEKALERLPAANTPVGGDAGDGTWFLDLCTTDGATVILSAQWRAHRHSLEWLSANGTFTGTMPAEGMSGEGFAVPAPAREGHVFTGWTVVSGLDKRTAQWGTDGTTWQTVESGNSLCSNGATGAVWFLNLASEDGGRAVLFANWNAEAETWPAPAGLEASTNLETRIHLRWNSVAGHTGQYALTRGRSDSFGEAEWTVWTTGREFYDDTAEAGVEYRYWVSVDGDEGSRAGPVGGLRPAGAPNPAGPIFTLDSEGTLTGIDTCGFTVIDVPPGVRRIAPGLCAWNNTITSVTIPEGVTGIGSSAFSECGSLVSVSIPSTVVDFGADAFADCPNLREVHLADGLSKIGVGAFFGDSALTSVEIPPSVEAIGSNAFWYCTGLTDLTIPRGVKDIGDRAFRNCEGLTNRLFIPGTVRRIGIAAFSSCSALPSVVLEHGVHIVEEGAFSLCQSLKTALLPPSVQSVGYNAFGYCDSLVATAIMGSPTNINAAARLGPRLFDGTPESMKLYVSSSWRGNTDYYEPSTFRTRHPVVTAPLVNVAFRADGGEGDMARQYVPAGFPEGGCFLPPNGFKKAGMKFAGWGTSAGGGVVWEDEGWAETGGDLELHAQWTDGAWWRPSGGWSLYAEGTTDGVELAWSPVDGATGYRVESSPNGTDWSELPQRAWWNANRRQWREWDRSMAGGAARWYRCTATNEWGEGRCGRDVVASRKACVALGGPGAVVGAEGGTGNVSVEANGPWVAEAEEPWVTIGTQDGDGPRTLTWAVPEHTKLNARYCWVRVYPKGTTWTYAGQSYLVCQSGRQAGVAAVTLKPNGGMGSDVVRRTKEGRELVLEPCPFRNPNGSFLGWATNAALTTAEYKDGATLRVSGDLDLFAVWGAAEMVDVRMPDGPTLAVEKAWLDRYAEALAAAGGDYEAAAVADWDGDGAAAWEEYVAGTSPEDKGDVFKVTGWTWAGGEMVPEYGPKDEGTRTYTVEAADEAEGVYKPTPEMGAAEGRRFYRVRVEMK